MTIALSLSETQSWSPPWIEPGQQGPQFFYRPASVTEREMFEGDMAALAAMAVFPWHLTAAFNAGLLELLPDQPEEVARLQDLRSRIMNGDESDVPTKVEVDEVNAVTDVLNLYYPPFQRLVAQAARREAILPVVAFRRFVTGWEGVTGPDGAAIACAHGLDKMVREPLMQSIDGFIIRMLGIHIYNSLYARGAEKNSAPPSPSGNGQKTSRAKTKKAGSLTKTDGTATQP